MNIFLATMLGTTSVWWFWWSASRFGAVMIVPNMVVGFIVGWLISGLLIRIKRFNLEAL